MSQIEIARAIATVAHSGQVDKTGAPYIEHPARVAGFVEVDPSSKGAIATYVAAAWLHDVVEDTAVTLDDLNAAGIQGSVITAVQLLTKVPGEPNADYYERIRDNHMARTVKLADIRDNLDPRRLAKLDDETIARLVRKYAKALEALDA